jgi:hypothetical protein
MRPTGILLAFMVIAQVGVYQVPNLDYCCSLMLIAKRAHAMRHSLEMRCRFGL